MRQKARRDAGRIRPRLEDTLSADTIEALERRAKREKISRSALHDRILREALGLIPVKMP